jgi:hypothetical protein
MLETRLHDQRLNLLLRGFIWFAHGRSLISIVNATTQLGHLHQPPIGSDKGSFHFVTSYAGIKPRIFLFFYLFSLTLPLRHNGSLTIFVSYCHKTFSCTHNLNFSTWHIQTFYISVCNHKYNSALPVFTNFVLEIVPYWQLVSWTKSLKQTTEKIVLSEKLIIMAIWMI